MSMPNICYLSVSNRVLLNQNYIPYVPVSTLDGLQLLKILNLSANRIAYVDDISDPFFGNFYLPDNDLRNLPDLYGQKIKLYP